MFKKRLELTFLSVIIISLLMLSKNYYDDYIFKNSDISDEYKQRIINKEQEILKLMYKYYGFSYKFPLIITDKFKGKLYGLTSFDNSGIKIYLNKNVMRESMDYVVDTVLAHEYAHALMFKMGHIYSNNDGHSDEWRQTCINLGGVNCEQYVNHSDVIMGKLPF